MAPPESKTIGQQIQQIHEKVRDANRDFLTATSQTVTAGMTKQAIKAKLQEVGITGSWFSSLKTEGVAEQLRKLELYADSIMTILDAYGANDTNSLRGGLKKPREQLIKSYKRRLRELEKRKEQLQRQWGQHVAALHHSLHLTSELEGDHKASIREALAELKDVKLELAQIEQMDLGGELSLNFLLQEYRRVFNLFQQAKPLYDELLNLKTIKKLTRDEQVIHKRELNKVIKDSQQELHALDADVRRLRKNFEVTVTKASQGLFGTDLEHLRPKYTNVQEVEQQREAIKNSIAALNQQIEDEKLNPDNADLELDLSLVFSEKQRLQEQDKELDTFLDVLKGTEANREHVLKQATEELREIASLRVELKTLKDVSRKVDGLIIYLDVSQAHFNNYVKIVRALLTRTYNKLGPASLDITFAIGMSLGVQQGGVSATFGLAFEIGVGMNVQDDRRFRTVTSYNFKALAKLTFPKVFDATAALSVLKYTHGNVYLDEFQWAAWLAHRTSLVWAMLRGAGKLGRLNRSYLSPKEEKLLIDTANELMRNDSAREQYNRFSELLQLPVTRAKSLLVGSLEASLLALKGTEEDVAFSLGASVNTIPQYLYFYAPQTRPGADRSKVASLGEDVQYKFLKAKAWEGSATVSLPGALSATLKFSRISNHANPDNDGSYFNFSLSKGQDFQLTAVTEVDPEVLSNPFGPAGSEEIPGFVRALERVVESFPDLNQSELPQLTAQLGPIVSGASWNQALSIGLTLEFNFGLVGKVFRLQYYRLSLQKSYSANTSLPIPALPVVSAEFAISGKLSSTLKEWCGDNTLAYVLTVYNGYHRQGLMKPRRLSGNEDCSGDMLWKQYCKAQRKQLWSLFRKVATPGTSVREEALVLQGTKSNPDTNPLLYECRLQQINGKSPFNEMKHERLLGALQRLLHHAQAVNDAERESKWKPLPKKNSSSRHAVDSDEALVLAAEGLPLKQKALEKPKSSMPDKKKSNESLNEGFITRLKRDFEVVDVAADGNCLFRAIALTIGLESDNHLLVRFQAVEHMRRHPDLFPEGILDENLSNHAYLAIMKEPARGAGDMARWGGGPELVALSQFYRQRIVVHAPTFFLGEHVYEELAAAQFVPAPNRPDIHLYFHEGNHYMALCPRARHEFVA